MAQNMDNNSASVEEAEVAVPAEVTEYTDGTIAPLDKGAVNKRLQKELMDLMMANEKGISAFPEGDNLFKWVGTITGPDETVFANQKYRLSLEFSDMYPYAPPLVKFVTPCFHPNVDNKGLICLDILQNKWSALLDVRTVLLSIQSLLGEPNIESPLNVAAGIMWENQEEYKKTLNDFYKRHKIE